MPSPAHVAVLTALTRMPRPAVNPDHFDDVADALSLSADLPRAKNDAPLQMRQALAPAAVALEGLRELQRKHPGTLARVQEELKLPPTGTDLQGMVQTIGHAAEKLQINRASVASTVIRKHAFAARGYGMPHAPRDGWAVGRSLILAAAASVSEAAALEAAQPGTAAAMLGQGAGWTQGVKTAPAEQAAPAPETRSAPSPMKPR